MGISQFSNFSHLGLVPRTNKRFTSLSGMNDISVALIKVFPSSVVPVLSCVQRSVKDGQ